MSNFTDYFFEHDIENVAEMNEKNFFRCEVKDFFNNNQAKPDEELTEFYNLIYPERSDTVYYRLFCQSPEANQCASFGMADRDKFINTLMLLSDYHLNVYYSPAAYKEFEHCSENAKDVCCLIADIDETNGFSPIDSTKEEIISYIKNTYLLSDNDLPYYILCSGRGMHLIWITQQKLTPEEFERFQRSIATKFKSDFMCSSVAHFFRSPKSFNVKNTPVRTKLHKINPVEINPFSMSCFVAEESEVEVYYALCYKKKNEKAEATMAKNGTKRGRKPKEKAEKKATKSKTKKKSKPKAEKKDTKREIVVPENYRGKNVSVENIQSVLNLNCYERGHNDINIAKDLIHYIIRREGQVYGYRNMLAHLIANYLSPHLCKEDCSDLILQLFEDDFAGEADEIIDKAYANLIKRKEMKKPDEKIHGPYYKYNYRDIAEMLNFVQEDIDASYSAFTEERRRMASKERVRRYRAKKSQEIKERKTEQYEVIKNSKKTAKELAFFLGISERTVFRIRQKIREDIKRQELEQAAAAFC